MLLTMYLKDKGIFDHPPLTNDHLSDIPPTNSGETGNQINWGLIIIIAVSGIIIGYGIKIYLDSKEKEKKYTIIEVPKKDMARVDKN